MVKLC